jgi:hypothetical protein
MEGVWLWLAVVIVQALMDGLVAWRLWEARRVRRRSEARLARLETRMGDLAQQIAYLEGRLGFGMDRQHLHG